MSRHRLDNYPCSMQCRHFGRPMSRWRGPSRNRSLPIYRFSSQATERELRVAVIGSGPAGFYASHRILKQVPRSRIDMYEALPVPFGLVRYGVAPDHPEVKNCRDKFAEIAQRPEFRFIGNVAVGMPRQDPEQVEVGLATIRRHYHAIILAYGASQDKLLCIPGEGTVAGIYSARQFVGWYNGLPQYRSLSPNLAAGEDVVIIGHGNVALDVARILLTPIDRLRKTDITEEALSVLSASKVRKVRLVGRRGPLQASFTIKEARELMNLPGMRFEGLNLPMLPTDLSTLPRPSRRLMEVLLKGSVTTDQDRLSRSWSLDFCLAPRNFSHINTSHGRLVQTDFDQTILEHPDDPKSRAATSPGGLTSSFDSDLVFRSTGYQAVPLDGFDEVGVHFNEARGIVSNDGAGRAIGPPPQGELQPKVVPGIYCTGWVKTGPTGTIASTMQDAFSTADALSRDWLEGRCSHAGDARCGWDSMKHELSEAAVNSVVSWADWKKIDLLETERGRKRGKVSEKFTSHGEMLAVLS